MKPPLSLDALVVLDAVARCGSFAAAAESLHRVPSAVTYTVRKLERSLGVRLFDRGGGRARLTPAGALLLEEGRALLRLAGRLAQDVQRVATGWETTLRVAVSDVVPLPPLLALCEAFLEAAPQVRLRLAVEVLGGTWDALVSGRADLVIGAPGEGPTWSHAGMAPMGDVHFVFVVRPDHPLAEAPEPLAEHQIRPHRAVAAADSSRELPPRTVGLLPGQPVFTVPDLATKRAAQLAGLGVGYLPWHMVREDVAAGRLRVKRTAAGARSTHRLYYAWRPGGGLGLAWWRARLCEGEPIDWFGERGGGFSPPDVV